MHRRALVLLALAATACGGDPAPPAAAVASDPRDAAAAGAQPPVAVAPEEPPEAVRLPRAPDPVEPVAEPPESEDAELERFVTTHAESWWEEEQSAAVPAAEQAHRREIVLAQRARAASDIAAGSPRVMFFGKLFGAEHPDVDPETGFLVDDLGCIGCADEMLETLAYNAAIHRARKAGLIKSGSFLDRFVTVEEASAWLKSRARTLERGGGGVALPDGGGEVRIPQERVGRSNERPSVDLLDIERPSVWKERPRGWPDLRESRALIAFREDGRVYVVAEPADAERWTRCHVFDTATGYHVHTLSR